MNQEEKDLGWMAQAIELARRAGNAGEVPIGAVIVQDGKCIGEGWNRPIAANDPSAHAEIEALRAAGAHEKNYRLPGATLIVTLEPCLMCLGAMLHARVARLVFGASDPKLGGAARLRRWAASGAFNHRLAVRRGLRRDECAALLRDFFRSRRQSRRPD